MTTDPVAAALHSKAALDLRLLGGQNFEQEVRQRMASLGIESRPQYAETLTANGAELEAMVGRLAVPETWIFRYPASFEFLVDHLRRRRSAGPLLLLSVACAAGQEAFSMAAAALHAGCDPGTTRILAIDRQADLIAAAQRGRIPDLMRRDRLPDWAQRWFTNRDQFCIIDDALRQMVDFEVGDALTIPLPAQRSTAIFCRNLLIYLGEHARRLLLARLVEQLEPAGLLFLGHADRASEAPVRLERVGPPQSFAFQRALAATAVAPAEGAAPPRKAPIGAAALQPIAADRSSIERARREETGASGSVRAASGQPASGRGAAPATLSGPRPSVEEAQRLADDGRLEDAASVIRAVVAREGQSAATAEILGVIALAKGELLVARRHFEESVYLAPRRATALLHLALLLDGLGDRERAASMRARAKRASPAAE